MEGLAANAQEAFAIMLQERIDNEFPELRVRVDRQDRIQRRLGRRVREADVTHRIVLLWLLLGAYRRLYVNDVSSPQHYLQVLLEDLRGRVHLPDPELSQSSVQRLARPFQQRFRRGPLASALMSVCNIVAQLPVEDLVEMADDLDVPDLVSTSDDDDDHGEP